MIWGYEQIEIKMLEFYMKNIFVIKIIILLKLNLSVQYFS